MQKPHNHLLGGRGGGQSDRLLSRRNELAREEDGVAG